MLRSSKMQRLSSMARLACFSVMGFTIVAPCVIAQEGITPTPNAIPAQAAEQKALVDDTDAAGLTGRMPENPLFAKFTKLLTGAKLRGQFTVDGKPLNNLTEETYEISKVEKQPDGDLWVITARIKYGKRDMTFPVPLEVKWAGSTPVLTLDNMVIPGFGTFGARVVFHKDKYAGTWQHDEVGGHMFGLIELADTEKTSEEE